MTTIEAPTKACHNCRRQRLRCDRSYPHCNKCIAAGKECLGYGKLFRWTGAVASRGKLAGRTSSAPVDDSTRPNTRSRLTPPASTPSHSPSSVHGSGRESPFYPRPRDEPPLADQHGTVASTADLAPEDAQLITRPRSTDNSSISSPWVLVDPLFQDLEPSNRYYLSYFTQRLCKDLVSQDHPDRNPFRTLLPLTRAHPLLQHIIVAASAAHMSNLVRASHVYSNDANQLLGTAEAEEASARAYRDALVAKHKALSLMRDAVRDVDSTGGDVILAAALFFINVELIESGKHGWKAHLEGAGRIMSLLQPALPGNEALRDYMLSDCFVYFILGSAFMPAAAFDTGSFFQPSQIPSILGRAAANSYLCCPPEILAILHAASQLSNASTDAHSDDEIRAAGLALIQRAQAFDINAWANDVRNISYLQDAPIQSRIHAGSAHRLAACLYILQAIPSLSEMKGHDEVAESLSRDIFKHLSSIPDDDPNFKATTWPTFIVGAEATGRVRREWVMNRLRRLVVSCPWGFLYTAMDTLQVIWSLDGQNKGTRGWVQTLKDPKLNFLIV
ncbi:hypothetical protein PLIIFM63780_000479 [Purpureocillium lilacinum]|uniref:Transcriptional regulator family: Fungal Specific TF n=1 Tax=Purpureocillium lilacinum TaxID=33203 RepID=A0ABR0BKR0_PURLI|nr:transcriptional regulator family: Fungal Specific TF [Purpureocillium lilacinum]GJN76991.1 hypothetical protein PLIIFM63780_000479 [Purpureocillium lilacinum]